MQLSSWSEDLLGTLAWKLRVTSATQLSRASGVRRELVIRRLRKLKHQELIDSAQIPIHDWQLPSRLLVWPSETWERDMQKLPWLLERRWKALHRSRDLVVWIAPRGVHVFGGFGGRLRQRLQLQHDLGVAATYFSFSRKRRSKWVGEDHFRAVAESQPLRRVPDAILRWSKHSTAIEFGGLYCREKLLRFHREMKRRRVRYEIY